MSDLSTRPDIITVNNIIKEFTVRKNKSLKERIVNVGRAAKFDERFTALNDVSFTVKAGESIGLIGANGSGKSTMLKMIGGILTPDSGNIQVRGRIAALLEL
ncbi:MAG: ABC transporter ATP-binding protein, partial [Actinomycetaceae bacterium]|nr:ABC transporter ATP-binding protein [Actinomycetaceae bacterium]